MLKFITFGSIILLSLESFGQSVRDQKLQEAGMLLPYDDLCEHFDEKAIDATFLFEFKLKENGYSMLEDEYKKPGAIEMEQINIGESFIIGYFEGVSSLKGDAEACKAVRRYLSKKRLFPK